MIISFRRVVSSLVTVDVPASDIAALCDKHRIPANTDLAERVAEAEEGEFWDALTKLGDVEDEDITEEDIEVDDDDV